MTSAWTDELTAKISELWKTKSASQIAGILWLEDRVSFTRNAVVGRLHRQKLTIEQKEAVHPKTRENGAKRPRVPKHEAKGAPTGSLAYKVIHGIKRKLAAAPVDPMPFVCREAANTEPLNIALIDLQDGDCRWPFDAPAGSAVSHVFCGHPALEGKPYCPGHTAIASAGIPSRKNVHPTAYGQSKGGIFGRVA